MKIIEKYYKETEYLLYNYKMFEISINNMEMEIDYLKKEDGSKGLSYDSIPTSKTYKINSSTEDTALSITEKIDYIEHSIKRMQSKIDSLNKALKGLSDVEKDVITKKYISGKQWFVVAYEVNFCERQCRNIRTDAIKKIALGMYGDVATSLPHLGK